MGAGGKVRLAGRVPDDQYNGLTGIAGKLVDNPHDVVMAVAKLDVAEIRRIMHDPADDRYEDDELVPVVRVIAVEPLMEEPEKERAAELFKQAYFERTGEGRDTLPIELPRSRDARETGETGYSPPFIQPDTDVDAG